MILKVKILIFLTLIIYNFGVYRSSFYEINISEEAAERAAKHIERIKRGEKRLFKFFLKKEYFTEEEINSYIYYRMKERTPSEIKEVRIFFGTNGVLAGFSKIDLTDSTIKNLPEFFKGEFPVAFEGKILSEEGKIKLKINKLMISNVLVSPLLVNQLTDFFSKGRRDNYKSINEWFDLPYGIKRVLIKDKKLIVFY
ncbi:MAG: hypothetical protein AB1410_11790 [Acidobacteriota bacterium]